jgi:hypothetical protein
MVDRKEMPNEKARATPLATGIIPGLTKIPAPPVTLTAQPDAEEEWARFSADLALVLADLDEDDFLIISAKKTGLFVQFAAQGQFGMRAEAISNNYLKGKTLSQDACITMQNLGWNAPTNLPEESDPEGHTADGSPNFFIDAAPPVPHGAIASLAVATLRFVFPRRASGSVGVPQLW